MLIEDQPTREVLPEPERPRRWPRRALIGGVVALVVLVAAFLVAAFGLSGASLESEAASLGRVEVQTFGGSVQEVHATGPGGREIPVGLHDGRVIPKHRLSPGEPVQVEAVVKRPGWIGWLAGGEQVVTLTMRAPVAHLDARWLTVAGSSSPRVTFNRPVSVVSYGQPGELEHRRFAHPRRSVDLGEQPSAGSAIVAAAVAPWERPGHFHTVTWFPSSGGPAVAATPAAGSDVTPSTPLRLTFSKPVAKVLGGERPKLSPEVPGRWSLADRHTLVFHPKGFGAPFDTSLKAELPQSVTVVQADGSTRSASEVEWKVPAGSVLRLQQLLAQTGYLPVEWKPDKPVAKTPESEVHAAIDPPSGHFSWRFHNTPAPLKEMWAPGEEGTITEGAVMRFQDEHGMETDGVAGPEFWEALMKAAIAGERSSNGYNYVHVSETLPETVQLWHNGKIVVEGAANTGIPGAETELGTFPVFEHLEETTMSGENPDGSHYNDPGIMWVSYFNGGDALHAFDRASYGTPQSLGCVEMPLEEAAKVYPYTPIGTLVTVAS
ncbi:MAG TPA: L,D-transpeptidase family protein [Solirubrobacterales bacterium]